MANTPSELRYTKEHEWVRVDGGTATVGITDFAQRQLGDVVFVELPEAGRKLDAQEELGTVESVKAVSEIFTPVSGSITAVNAAVTDDPELLNTDPYGDGWLVKIKMSNASEVKELLTAAQYDAFISDASG